MSLSLLQQVSRWCRSSGGLRDDRADNTIKVEEDLPITPQRDVRCENFATRDAVLGLMHASNTLSNLKHLTLYDSPITVADIPNFCDALLGFAGSLTELGIDAWKDTDNSVTPPSQYSSAVRRLVLDSISQLHLLEKLSVRDWVNLAASDCQGGGVLRHLKRLEAIHVGLSFPCQACKSRTCMHFDSGLPFKSRR